MDYLNPHLPFFLFFLFGCFHGSHLYQRERIFIKVHISSTSASWSLSLPIVGCGPPAAGGRGRLGARCGPAHLASLGSRSSGNLGVHGGGAPGGRCGVESAGPSSKEMFVFAAGAAAAGWERSRPNPRPLGLPGRALTPSRTSAAAPRRGMVRPSSRAHGRRLPK